jgi:hypothetical protein
MADSFKLLGSYEVAPQGSQLSFAPQVIAQISETRTLVRKLISDVQLTADPIEPVDFGGVVSAHVLELKATGGKVLATITTADGVAQVIPVDSSLILICDESPVTALSLTRKTGIPTTVRVFLGEKA